MNFDTFLAVASFVMVAISFAIIRYCENHVKATYKDQKVGGECK